MKKQPIIIALVAAIIVALGIITYGIYKSTQDNGSNNNQQNNSAAQQEALDEARAFQPPEGMMCTQVMTPAVHKETGATHTFTSGCLPEGWVKDDSAGSSPRSSDTSNQSSPEAVDTNKVSTQPRENRDMSQSSQPQTSVSSAAPTDTTGSRDQLSAEEQALREARSFRPGPDVRCTQVLTPAIHKATGVRYTFPTGCLPDGWVRDSDTTPRSQQ